MLIVVAGKHFDVALYRKNKATLRTNSSLEVAGNITYGHPPTNLASYFAALQSVPFCVCSLISRFVTATIAKQASQIATLQSQVTTLQSQVASIQSTDTTQNTNIANLQCELLLVVLSRFTVICSVDEYPDQHDNQPAKSNQRTRQRALLFRGRQLLRAGELLLLRRRFSCLVVVNPCLLTLRLQLPGNFMAVWGSISCPSSGSPNCYVGVSFSPAFIANPSCSVSTLGAGEWQGVSMATSASTGGVTFQAIGLGSYGTNNQPMQYLCLGYY